MIVWNLVCSFAIDVPNLPITTLENIDYSLTLV